MSIFQKILSEISEKLGGFQSNKGEIVKILTRVTGIAIGEDQIQVKNEILFVNVSPTIKTAIRLKQNNILVELNKYNIKAIG